MTVAEYSQLISLFLGASVGFFGLAMALVFCAVVILARIFDIRIGNNDDD